MSTIKTLMSQIRMQPQIADNDKTKISDYQLLAAINKSLESIYIVLADTSSDITVKSKTLAMNGGSAKLPSDLIAIYEVMSKVNCKCKLNTDIIKKHYQ